MSKDASERFVSRGNSIEALNAEIVQEVEGYKNSLNLSLSAAIQPVLDLPISLGILQSEGRQSDMPALTGLVKMLARDTDALLAEKKTVDDEFASIQSKPPTKKNKLSDHHAKLMNVGGRYLALSQRSVNTVGNTLGDYMQLIDPIKPTVAVEEPSEELS